MDQQNGAAERSSSMEQNGAAEQSREHIGAADWRSIEQKEWSSMNREQNETELSRKNGAVEWRSRMEQKEWSCKKCIVVQACARGPITRYVNGDWCDEA
jgi:hypothetical protein